MSGLNQQVAIVTGAGRGVGLATAQKLSRAGASVVVNDLDADVASNAADLIRAEGGDAIALSGDVTGQVLRGIQSTKVQH